MTPLLVAVAATLSLEAPQFIKTPDIHGDTVVFEAEDDLWVGEMATKTARRLTNDAGVERNAEFSPDGARVAFEGEYDGLREAYVMPTEGGAPRRLTLTDGFRAVTGWTRDGAEVVYRRVGQPTNYWYMTVPAEGGAPQRVGLEFASHVDFRPDGPGYAYTRFNRWYAAWWRYEGGMQNQVWYFDGERHRQVTFEPGTCEYPVWCRGEIYYAHERDAQFTIRRVRPGSKPETVYGPVGVELRELASDGKRIVFEEGVGATVYDPASKSATMLRFQLGSDEGKTRAYTVEAMPAVTWMTVTPTGKRVLAEARGQIVSMPVGEGEARVWKERPGARLRWPVMSPDGKRVAYVSDETGEQQVWVADADGGDARAITGGAGRQVSRLGWSPDSKWVSYFSSAMELRVVPSQGGAERVVAKAPYTWFGVAHDWSPDSKWIAYSAIDGASDLEQVWLYSLEDGKRHRVSDGRSGDFSPAFSSDGAYLVVLTRRALAVANDPVLNQLNLGATVVPTLAPLSSDAPNPFAPKDDVEPVAVPAASEQKPEEKKDVRVDLEGLFARRIELPISAGRYSQAEMVGSRVLLAGGGQVTYYDLARKAGGTLTAGERFEVSADQKKLLVDGSRVVDAMGENVPADAGRPKAGGLRLRIEPTAEWRQIFWDAWRHLRDYFYAANMHGLDWKAVGDRYAKFLPSVRSRSDLDELVRWMQCELGSSHQYLSEGDNRDIKPRLAPGFLGIDLVPDGAGGYKIGHIVRGDGFRTGERSPLADPSLKVREGMHVLSIAGVPTRVGNDVFGGLVGRVGQVVGVRLNDKPGEDGARTVYVRPVANELRMRLLDWVESNRRYVERSSEGKVGYIYLDAMGDEDMSDFVKQYFAQRDRDALLIDVRFNNGGYVQDFINRVLASKLTGFFNMRESPVSWTRQQDYFSGPMACLMNEFSISCGEEFPHRFRDLGTGPLFGRRTQGGEVGSSPGWPLVDGGVISVPNYGMWTPKDGWVIEGPGVAPDYDVPSDPNAFAQGKDPQLDAAVRWLVAEARKRPPVRRTAPPDPVRVRRG